MKGLIPGRIVHMADATSGPMAHQAAIVTSVNDLKQGIVNLTVFAPGGGTLTASWIGVDGPLGSPDAGKLGGTMPTPGSWHWPEEGCCT